MKTVPSLKSEIVANTLNAQALRKESSELSGDALRSKNEERTGTLRCHARAALLAYAFLRGRPYGCVERKTKKPAYAFAIVRALGMASFNEQLAEVNRVDAWLRDEPQALQVAV